MRYFANTQFESSADRRMVWQASSLTDEEKKNDRLGKVLTTLSTLVFIAVMVAVFGGTLIAIMYIPLPSDIFERVLVLMGMIVLGIASFVASMLVGALACAPINRIAQKKLAVHKLNRFDIATMALREYYGWSEPCTVTACYSASDKRFCGRSVCLFVCDGELRVTADLKHGFSVRESDLGCYAFSKDEISLVRGEREGKSVTELKAGDVFFCLGRRAYGFIERYAAQTVDRE
jgi:hypothetical protein